MGNRSLVLALVLLVVTSTSFAQIAPHKAALTAPAGDADAEDAPAC
jgi:hypothetical protein